MLTIQCQFCQRPLAGLPSQCPHCQRTILATPVINYFGKILELILPELSKNDPDQATQRVQLYLKFCADFLIQSELALISAWGHRWELSSRCMVAVRDVIDTHRAHDQNLTIILVSCTPENLFLPLIKKCRRTQNNLDKLLNTWLECNFQEKNYAPESNFTS